MSTTDLSNNTMSENEEKVDIWYEKPNVLLTNINEILPLNTMNFNQKINALVRLVILLTILAYFFGQSVKYLFSGALSLVFIYAYSFYCNNEGFELYKDYIDENDLENSNSSPKFLNNLSFILGKSGFISCMDSLTVLFISSSISGLYAGNPGFFFGLYFISLIKRLLKGFDEVGG